MIGSMHGNWPSCYTGESSMLSVPRRARGARLKGVGAQLSDSHERSHARHQSDQSTVSQLGDSLSWYRRYYRCGIAPEWLGRFQNLGFVYGRNGCYQQLGLPSRCARERDATCSRESLPSTIAVKLLRQILPSVRFGAALRWRCCKRHTVSVPRREPAGLTVVSQSRHTTAAGAGPTAL